MKAKAFLVVPDVIVVLSFFLKPISRAGVAALWTTGTTNSQAPCKAPSLRSGGRNALLNFCHPSLTPTVAWTEFPSGDASLLLQILEGAQTTLSDS